MLIVRDIGAFIVQFQSEAFSLIFCETDISATVSFLHKWNKPQYTHVT